MSPALLSRTWLLAIYAVLYLPIVSLVVYSFNNADLPTVWRGFTLRWYAALAEDRELIDGLKLSLQVGLASASASIVLGTLAALAMERWKRFRGRSLMTGMLSAPLVMPEVVIGLSLLLFLVSVQRWLGFPQRGMGTIVLGHLLVGLAYATIVIRARLVELNPQFEEAALDLGARPWQAFFLVTLPLIAPSMASAWLLTFTLSFDDVVLSAFLSGPGSTTLPLVIFSRARLGLNPGINAVATVVILIVTVGVVIASQALARLRTPQSRGDLP